MLPCGGVLSLQDIAASSLHRTIGLRTVLPLLSWAKQHPVLLDATGDRCKRFIVDTFDALVDVEGTDAVSEALDDPELFAQLMAESEDRRRRIRALRTPGRVLNRPSSSAASPQSGAEDLAVRLGGLATGSPAHGNGADGAACTPRSTGAGSLPGAQQRLGFDSADPTSGAEGSGGGAGAGSPMQTPSSSGADGGVIAGGGSSKAGDRGGTSDISSTPAISNHAQYPYGSLVADVEWPPDVDAAHREQHLSEADFQEVFGVSRGAFEKLSAWKRLQLKKAKKLF